MCDDPRASRAHIDALREAILAVKPNLPIVETVLEPRPVEPVAGRRVAFFSTAPESVHARLAAQLEEAYGADVVLVSGNLARRPELRRDLDRPAARNADLYLVELKAAAIDVVAETAAERGVDVVFADNEVVPVDGTPDLDDQLLDLVEAATGEVRV